MSVPDVPAVHTGDSVLDSAINAIAVDPINDTLVRGLNVGVKGVEGLYGDIRKGADVLKKAVDTVRDDFDQVGLIIREIVSMDIFTYVSSIVRDAIGVSIDTAIVIVACATVVVLLGMLGGVLQLVTGVVGWVV